jgi:hypothetical protein
MDYDRLAMFLLNRTAPGFRRGLRLTPTATLNKAGFHPGESALLTAALGKIKTQRPKVWKDAFERVGFQFMKIDVAALDGGASAGDDWNTG